MATGTNIQDWGGRDGVFADTCLCVGSCGGRRGGGVLLDERARVIYCFKLAGLSLIGVIYKPALLVVPF